MLGRFFFLIALSAAAASCFAENNSAKKPELISIDDAKYPTEDLLPGIEVTANFLVIISTTGTIDKVSTISSSGFPPLDNAAITAIKTAKFTPALDKDGNPISVKIQMPYQAFQVSPSPVDRLCSGLNNEIKEYVRFNPTRDYQELNNLNVIRGLLMLKGIKSGSAFSKNELEKVSSQMNKIIKTCEVNPTFTILNAINAATGTKGLAPFIGKYL